ncbi:MAG: hypothetical protein V7677_16180 [Motiliproteus sp.]
MCSTPKGSSGQARAKISVGSVSSSLSSEQYTDMVQRSNLAYERRQRKLAAKKQADVEAGADAATEHFQAAAVGTGGFDLAVLLKKLLHLLRPAH